MLSANRRARHWASSLTRIPGSVVKHTAEQLADSYFVDGRNNRGIRECLLDGSAFPAVQLHSMYNDFGCAVAWSRRLRRHP